MKIIDSNATKQANIENPRLEIPPRMPNLVGSPAMNNQTKDDERRYESQPIQPEKIGISQAQQQENLPNM